MLCHGMGCEVAEPAGNNKAIPAKVVQECVPGEEEEKGRQDWCTWMGTGCMKTCLSHSTITEIRGQTGRFLQFCGYLLKRCAAGGHCRDKTILRWGF